VKLLTIFFLKTYLQNVHNAKILEAFELTTCSERVGSEKDPDLGPKF
jgi:hypothetical protein